MLKNFLFEVPVLNKSLFVEVNKKNSLSPLAAAFGLTCLFSSPLLWSL